MKDKVFLDTNILIYLYSIDEKDKQQIARDLIDNNLENIIISNQVINEFTNILFKNFKLSSEEIENALLEIDSVLPIVNFDLKTQIKAIRLKNRYKLQFYDSLIIATAIENNCMIIYSEDMHDKLELNNSITIINPFRNMKDKSC